MKKSLSLLSVFLIIVLLLSGCNSPSADIVTDNTDAPSQLSTDADEAASESEEAVQIPNTSDILGEPAYTGIVCGNGTTVASDIREEVKEYNKTASKPVVAPARHTDSTATVYSSATKEKYDKYINALKDSGGEVLAVNTIGSVYFTTLKLNERLITAYFITEEAIIRVIDEPYHEIDTVLPSPDSVPSGYSTKLITLPMHNNKEQCGFVIRLSDGRFVLYDTGHGDAAGSAEGLANTLKDYSYHYKLDHNNKIPIAAIYISHLHDDHYGGLLKLAENYSHLVSVERVYANFPSTQKEDYWSNPLELHEHTQKIKAAAETLGAEFQFVRSGHRVQISDSVFEVMFTPDDLGQYEIRKKENGEKDTSRDINNTCLYVRMTTKSGKKIIFVGDSRQGQTPLVCNMYKDGLKCDMLSVAHHGYNGSNTIQLYQTYGKPSTLLWTNTKEILDANTVHRPFIDALHNLTFVTEHVYAKKDSRKMIELEKG